MHTTKGAWDGKFALAFMQAATAELPSPMKDAPVQTTRGRWDGILALAFMQATSAMFFFSESWEG